jgi:hypothetical protein
LVPSSEQNMSKPFCGGRLIMNYSFGKISQENIDGIGTRRLADLCIVSIRSRCKHGELLFCDMKYIYAIEHQWKRNAVSSKCVSV